MIECSEPCSDISYVSKQPVKNIDEVRKLREQCASVHCLCSMPGCFFLPGIMKVITFITVPEAVKLNRENFTQLTAFNEFFCPYNWRRIPVLHHNKNMPVLL